MVFSKFRADEKEISIPAHAASNMRYIFRISPTESGGTNFKRVKDSPST